MKKLAAGLTGLGVLLLAQVALAAIVVKTDPSGNPASCGENQGGNTLNIGTPNAAVAVGDVLILVLSGVGANGSKNILTSISAQSGVSAWTSALAISSVYDPNGGGRSYVSIAKVTTAFSNGVGVTVTTSPANNFLGACMMDVGGLNGVIDQQAGVESSLGAAPSNVTPTVYNSIANELALAVSSCQNTLNLTTPINPPWTSIGVNGVGGCPAGFLITSSAAARAAVLNQSAPGSSAVGTVLIK
ncbi:MAG TPA: hypothetical protein VN742_12295 [Candidatus Binataceae bacterium]|nr:hypothetical protein [Candidatus Binataceae bacterium]